MTWKSTLPRWRVNPVAGSVEPRTQARPAASPPSQPVRVSVSLLVRRHALVVALRGAAFPPLRALPARVRP